MDELHMLCHLAVVRLLAAEILPSIIRFLANDSSNYAILLFLVIITFTANQTQ